MKIYLDKTDIEILFKDTDCIVVPYWDGDAATINKTDGGKFYMVRWEEYEPCTDIVDIDYLIDVTLSDGLILHPSDYLNLYQGRIDQ